MPSATVTVKYVNPPQEGGRRGSIKTVDNEYYGVWPENMHRFEPGRTYRIDYAENTRGDRTFKNVKRVLLAGSPAAPLPQAHSVPAASRSLTEGEWQLILALRSLIGNSNASPR
jgi:hypothetical protein